MVKNVKRKIELIIQINVSPTVIDQTEQSLQQFMLKKWQNRQNYQLVVKKYHEFFLKLAKVLSLFGLIFTCGFWLVYALIILADKLVLSGDEVFDYLFFAFLGIFAVIFWLLFRNADKLSEKILAKNKNVIQKNMIKNSRFYAKRVFRTVKKYPKGFTAIYEFNEQKIRYFRQIDGQKIHQWTRNIQPHYEIGENFVLFFKKPNAYSPKIFMFIDEDNKQNLINYLNKGNP